MKACHVWVEFKDFSIVSFQAYFEINTNRNVEQQHIKINISDLHNLIYSKKKSNTLYMRNIRSNLCHISLLKFSKDL